MKFDIKYQETYSKKELLLRSFFGIFYMIIPHYLCLMVLGIGAMFANFIVTLSVLFTGNYPKGLFNFMMSLRRWGMRLIARVYNLSDGYPAFGLDAQDEHVTFEVKHPENINIVQQWVKVLFGFFYVLIPHGIVLYLRMILGMIYQLIAWFSVLFTGKYPKNMHDFNVGTLRWANRLNLYMGFVTDVYPPFSGEIQPGEEIVSDDAVSGRSDIIDG